MNNYIPNELKDLTHSKERVMQNVVSEIQKTSRRPKHTWRYVVITAVLTMCAMLFVFNEIYIENDHQTAIEPGLDLTQPTFSEEQGLFYLHGVTLGDSQSRVKELLGEDYIKEDYEENTLADLILDYNGNARFYFYENKVVKILLMNVDKIYFDKLFNNYDGFKFISLEVTHEGNKNRFFYSKKTSQLIKAEIIPDGNLYFSLSYAPNLLENPDFPKREQIIK